MIEIVVAVVLFGAGWYVGNETSTVECKNDPLIIASCQEPTPLESDTFGATTEKLVEVGRSYKACRTACLAK